MDKVEAYDENKQLRTGCYYVETDQYFPMRGVGWYSLPMIEYCLENKLIKHKDIKYSIKVYYQFLALIIMNSLIYAIKV